jgi:hypothetical protein
MKTSSHFLNQLKVLSASIALGLGALGFSGILGNEMRVGASSQGPSPSHTAAPGEVSCTACHGQFPDNSGTGNVTISGIPKNYFPGQQVPVTVTVSQSDGVIYGFQLTAIQPNGAMVGTFSLPNIEPQEMRIRTGLVNGNQRHYVSHNSNGTTPTQFGSKSWTFTWTAPAQRVGKLGFYAAGNAANSDGSPWGDHIYTTSRFSLSGSAISNFDNDIRSDIAVYRPSNGVWYSLNSSDEVVQGVQFGLPEDIIVPGDYDGDGVTDRAVFRPSTGTWFILKSTDGFAAMQFGTQGDVPVPGDYDGDGISDVAVWRPSNGVWYIHRSSDGSFDFRQFGIATDKVVQADYDADGKTDIAVWRPENGVWYIWRSSDNEFSYYNFGLPTDRPVQADYDGDGKADIAVYRPQGGVWYILGSSQGFAAYQFGIETDQPVPADFDGDGRADVAVYRLGTWYILQSSDFGFVAYSFGLPEDVPVPSGYISR